MHAAEKLTRLLRDLVALVEQEAETNPAFAERLAAVLAPMPQRQPKRSSEGQRETQSSKPAIDVPDVFAAYSSKGEEEFGFWLRGLDIGTLRAIVKQNGFDPGKTARNWKEPDKFTALIQDQVGARLRRGSAFLTTRSDRPPEAND